MTDRLLRDRYRLVRPLSRNRASTTWEALDTQTNTRCVVKELSVGAALGDDSGAVSFDPDDFTKVVDLFEREARVLANLDHPAIPRFIDHFSVEEEGDTHLYTVQEFVEGKTLEALVESGRHFTEEEAMRICRDVADILGYLHGRSPPLVHRDVKPSNVILGDDGEVHLVDFGSVRTSMDAADGKTIVGTYGYMPIEQYEARAVPQSDFYALGMTLVFVLSHQDPTRIPRTGLTLDFRSHVNVSDRFARLIGWMIAPAPEDRPPDARAILDALDRNRLQLPDLLPAVVAETTAPVAFPQVAARVFALALGLLGLLVAIFGLLRSGVGLVGDHLGATTGGRSPQPASRAAPLTPRSRIVEAVDGTLRIDLDRDFSYVDTGWPMGRSVAQTPLPTPTHRAPGDVRLPPADEYDEVVYGVVPLGNVGAEIHYALVRGEGAWSLFLDSDGDGDLLDDGRAHSNEGSGPLLAAQVTANAPVRLQDGSDITRPYLMWIWFTESDAEVPRAHMYARNHYGGVVRIGGSDYDATVFERTSHDALYHDDGVCIDLDRDGTCSEESELFHDGDTLTVGRDAVRVSLAYP